MGQAIAKIGRVSNESVLKCTGKSWRQWITLLDKARAGSWQHGEITQLLKEKYELSAWWQQGVAIGYELHSGKRVEGRSERGLYSTVASKTLPLSQKQAWLLLSSEKGLEAWLQPFAAFPFRKGAAYEVDGGVFGEVRTVKVPDRLRFSWQEDSWAKPSIVQLGVHKRSSKKCMVVIQHGLIPSEPAKTKLRSRWKNSVARLALLTGAGK